MTAGGFFPRGRKVCGTLLVETVFDRASATIIDTFMAFTTQRLSVAVQYSAAQEVAEALGLSVAADPRAAH